jgi:hypothetical protein
MKSMDIQQNPEIRFYALVYGMGIIVMVVFTLLQAFFFMKVSSEFYMPVIRQDML